MKTKTVAFHTLGCKINQYETEAIRGDILDLGYEEVPPTAPADVYVVNTCAVTAVAGRKSRRYVLRAARANPDARIIVVGCSTASEKEKLARIPQVALLAGNEEKAVVADFLDGRWAPGEPLPEGENGLLGLDVSGYRERTRATVKVQDGCNNFCSFCVIPHLRGLSRSRRAEAVVDEVRRLVDNGYLEIVVSGVHLQDYGLDLDPPSDLVSLLERLAAVPGLERIRLSSLGPRAFTDRLIHLLEEPVFCRHWHVPIQAGCDAVLERMRRGYTVAGFARTVEVLRERFEDPAITTDVIVGHPGETRERFEESLELYRELRFAKIHVFPFSSREGTLAVSFRDRVDPAEVERRARVLGEVETDLGAAYRRRFVGRELDVLVEGRSRDDDSALEGMTGRYLRVRFPAPSEFAARRFPGTIRRVRATAVTPAGLRGDWSGEGEGEGGSGSVPRLRRSQSRGGREHGRASGEAVAHQPPRAPGDRDTR